METISRRQSFSEKGINVMSEKEKIIVFSSREICYQSSSFFANQMADAFEDLGFDVQVCEFDEHDDLGCGVSTALRAEIPSALDLIPRSQGWWRRTEHRCLINWMAHSLIIF